MSNKISEIEIKPDDPFSDESRKREMEKSDDFLSQKEYERLKNRLSNIGFTEYIHNGYHFFYQHDAPMHHIDASINVSDPFILAEREFGFYEEISVEINYCSPTIVHKNYHEEFLFKEDGVGKILVLDRSSGKIEIE